MERLINILIHGARTVGGLRREGIENALELAAANPQMFVITPTCGPFPVISLRFRE